MEREAESPRRRTLLRVMAGLGATATLPGCDLALREGIFNSCRGQLPAHLLSHPVLLRAWSGLDASRIVDAHCHLFGMGDGGHGLWFNPAMDRVLSPALYVQKLFYMNAGCVREHPGEVDASVVDRLVILQQQLPRGMHLLLFAFDWARDESGNILRDRSTFFVPDGYASAVARAHPDAFLWAASIHPYDPEAVPRLERAVAAGARAVKWLPEAQNIDPGSPRCDPFYRRLAELRVPLITHAGEERAVQSHNPMQGNPLRLRRALDAGVRVVIAHCASLGPARDTDKGVEAGPMVEAFDLFGRLMDETRYRNNLAGDISAVSFGNRSEAVLERLLTRVDWHDRLLYGSDYPLPGVVPLIGLDRFVARGMLSPEAVPVLREIREYHPILFDFVLKRSLSVPGPGGARFARSVFETRSYFA